MDALRVGDLVAARFTVTGPPLGAGSSGVVYPAVDADGESVVVKLLHDDVAEDAEVFAKLEAELRRAHAFSHPRVVPVLGLFAHGRSSVLVTKRVDGCSAAALASPLPPEAALAAAAHVLAALAAAHRAGVVHGDLRPGNVLIGRDGAHVFDFGMVGTAAARIRPGETPPEVAAGAAPGPHSDVYGVGLVLARLALGRGAFEQPTAWAQLGAQRAGRPRLDGLPAGVRTAIRQLLHPDPSRRPTVAAARRIVEQLIRRPGRVARWAPPIAPFALRRRFVVHGVDPTTGARSIIRAGLTRHEARAWVQRLDAGGWQAVAEPVALGPIDAAWVALAALVGFVAIPILGAPLFAFGCLRWRSSRLRPALPRVLPVVVSAVPPRRLGAVEARFVAAGLFAVGVLLSLISGWLALLPVGLSMAILAWEIRAKADPAAIARKARVHAAFARARAAIDGSGRPLDQQLGAAGAIEVLEHGWRAGSLGDEHVLGTVDGVIRSLTGPDEAARRR